MGIDKALTDDFPSVVIDGTRYQYGCETEYGQYLVENAEEAKDYWCFDTRQDLLAFLVNLPESADRDWIVKRHPDWHEVTHEQRRAYMKERDAHFRKLREEKQKSGTAGFFNVLCRDEAGWYCAYAEPGQSGRRDDVNVTVRKEEVPDARGTDLLIELGARRSFGVPEKEVFRVGARQALKLASALIRAALDIEARLPETEAARTT